MIQDPELQQKVIDTLLTTLQDPDPTVCQTAAIAIDHLETHLLESLKSPATPMTQADWDHIRHTVRQNLLK
jgi:vesicle coat complex subunit